MHRPGKRSLISVLALVSSSLLVLGGATQASSSPQSGPAAQAASAPSAGEPLGDDAVAVAREHLRANAAELELSAADVKQLEVSSVVPSDHNGLTHVYFQQRVNSLDIANAMVNVAVRADGTVFQVAENAVGSAAKLANDAKPGISDVQAAKRAAAALGLKPTEPFASDDVAAGAEQARELGDGGISQDAIPVRLVYQLTKGGALRLAWQLGIYQLDGEHWWQSRIDAETGAELGKDDLVAADSYNVYPLPVEAPTFASPAPPADGRTNVTNPAIAAASPFGWHDTNGVAGAEFTTTQGNNVHAYTDLDDNDLPDAGSSPDGGALLDFNFPLDLTQAPSTYRPAAVTNLFVTSNRMHDILDHYGFDAAAGNFQESNYGEGGLGSDYVNAEAQDGGGTNNANFATPADGLNPRMQMYVWTAPTPDRDGDLDNGIIVHEYGHGVSNRLTGGPANVACLGNSEQGGEGWSDYLAYMLTMPNGTEPVGGRGIGTYALNEPTTGPGIRQYPYSTNMVTNPHTYDDTKTVAVPHGVGSVWAEMLWEMTYALIGEHGFSANLDDGSVGGNKISLQLVMDGMKLQPCSPGFVDARNAILAADQANNGGANTCLIWTAFAKRGLGFSASQGSSATNGDNVEAFDIAPSCLGVTVTRTAAPDPVQAGHQLTYGFHIENTSDAPGGITGVSATGAVGDHATYLPGSATCSGTYDSGTEVVTFPIGAMALGASTDCEFKVTIDASPWSTTNFEDDFEPDLSAWTTTHGAGTLDWALTVVGPHSPTNAAFAADPTVISDQYLTLATPVTVAAGDQLSFWHSRDLEGAATGFDGGVVEVSTDGTTWTDIGAANFVQNGYSHTISSSYSSPIAGRPAFSGVSPYVESVANLAAYVGQSIRVRFRMASDTSVGDVGWTVDDVRIGTNVFTTSTGTAAATGAPLQNNSVTTEIVEPTTTVPAAPTVTGSTPSAGAVSVAFTPGSDGGSAITGYTAECVSTDGGVTDTGTGASSPISVTGLSAGKSYHCRVRATNAVGDGPYSGFGDTVVVPATVPGAPTVTGSTPSAGAVSVAFTPPASDGGSAITGYTAECVSTDGGVTDTGTGASSPISVTGLSAGKSYHCRVLATNTVGDGPYSGFGDTVVVPANVPGAPTVTGSTPSAGAVSVAFTPPASDGGSAITGYTAECVSTDGGVTNTGSGAASPISVSGLSAGKSYHCRVLATNAAGDGPYSGFGDTVVVPATVPGAPTVTGSTPSAGAVSVAFTPGSDGGSAITGYTAECVSTDGGVTNSATGASSPISVTGLSAGKSYHCRVRATNAVGDGPYSGFGATVTLPAPPPAATVPGKPVITSSVPVSKKKAKISFTLASDGGSPVTSYKVRCVSKNGGKTRSATGPASPIKVKKLTPGKTYKCKVRATNAVGTGPWSKKGKKFTMPAPRAAVISRQVGRLW
ncbi:M36 family metallopeptidase [Nocardioides dilutus]